MDIHTSCSILGISTEKITQKSIKKAYFKQALLWHPDKNKHPDSNHMFQMIQDAYAFLMSNNELEPEDDYTFITNFMGLNIESGDMRIIIEHLKKGCEETAFNIIEGLDNPTSNKIYCFLKQYYFLFGIEYAWIKKLGEKINILTEIVTLNPKLENLFNNDIYNLETDTGEKYYIPLWHDELEFNNEHSNLIVRVDPVLPENVEIDDDNNVHISTALSIRELLGKEFYNINISSREFIIEIHKLVVKNKQTICFKHSGIAQVNTNSIFSVSNISNVFVHIELVI